MALVSALALPHTSDAAQAPKGFFGVHPLRPADGDYPRMAGADVGIIRTGFVFAATAPPSPLPDGWSGYDWTKFDEIVKGAAEQGIDVLPVLLGAPGYPAKGSTPLDSPASTNAWKRYLKALVGRYGPGGDFWADPATDGIPDDPIDDWQVWNEPNSFNNWTHPNPKQYGKLLALSAKAIHSEDPAADVVSAGVISQPVNRRADDGDVYLKKMLRSKSAAKAADTIAIHPYTGTVKEVKKQIKLTREVLDKAKLKRTPIWVTEIGWGEGRSRNPLIVPASKQRKNLRESFRMMLKERRKLKIGKAVWYQWQDSPDTVCGWCSTAGLLNKHGSDKKLLDEFAAIARR
ncbi:MAG: glycosyl hydrolase [Solirubrobacterales bacterium]